MIRKMRRMNEAISEDFDFSIFKKYLGNGTFPVLDYIKDMIKDDPDITYVEDSEYYMEILSMKSRYITQRQGSMKQG